MPELKTFMLGFGIVLAAAGVLMAIQRLRTVFFGASVDGVVVDQKISTMAGSTRPEESGKATKLYAPIVEFAHGGSKVRFTSTLGRPQPMPKGTRVPVRYLPGDPAGTAEIATPLRTWGFPLVAVAGGLLLIVLGR